jgi:hypothetical protein
MFTLYLNPILYISTGLAWVLQSRCPTRDRCQPIGGGERIFSRRKWYATCEVFVASRMFSVGFTVHRCGIFLLQTLLDLSREAFTVRLCA